MAASTCARKASETWRALFRSASGVLLQPVYRRQACIQRDEDALSVGALPVLMMQRKVHGEDLPREVVVTASREDTHTPSSRSCLTL